MSLASYKEIVKYIILPLFIILATLATIIVRKKLPHASNCHFKANVKQHRNPQTQHRTHIKPNSTELETPTENKKDAETQPSKKYLTGGLKTMLKTGKTSKARPAWFATKSPYLIML